MKRKRYISAPVFRVILFILLGVITAIWLRWLILDSGPYHWLQQALLWIGRRESQILGALLAYLLVFIVWMIPTTVLRYFTDMPWLFGEERREAVSAAATFRESFATQRRRQGEMLERDADDPARRRFFRQMGWIGIGVGLVAFLATWMGWYLSGQIWTTPLAVGLVGVLGGLLSALTGRPLLFDQGKITTIRRVVARGVKVILILTLLFLAVMCVWQALQ